MQAGAGRIAAGRRRLEPVALALERRRSGRSTRPRAGSNAAPVDGSTAGRSCAIARQDRGDVRLGPRAARDASGTGGVCRPTAATSAVSTASGPELERSASTPCGRPGGERRRRTAPPRGRAGPSSPASAPCRRSASSPVTLDTTGMRGAWKVQSGRDRAELVEHRVHQRRVERVADRQPRRLAAQLLPRPAISLDRVLVAGDHHRPRAVDAPRSTRCPRPVSGAATSSSVAWTATIAPPAGSACISRPRAATKRGRVRQRQHPGDVRGGELADRVPEQEVRAHAARLHQPEQRDLDREQRRPGCTPSGRAARSRARRERPAQRRPARVQVRAAPRPTRRRTPGSVSYSSRAHAHPLRALAGEQERRLAAARGPSPHSTAASRAAASARGPPGARPIADDGRARSSTRGRSPARTRRRPADVRRAQTSARSRSACARSAAGVLRRDSTAHGNRRRAQAHGAGLRIRPAASSMITCALVPLMPNEDTAGAPRPLRSGQASGARQQPHRRPRTSRRAATARPTCSVRGSAPCRMAITILITPPTPAAACVCPMFDFSDPSHSGGRPARSCP